MRPSTLTVAFFAAASSASTLWQPIEMIKREFEPLRREIELMLPHKRDTVEKRQASSSSKFNLSVTNAEGQVSSTTAAASDASQTASGDSSATGTQSGDSSQTTGSESGSRTTDKSGSSGGNTRTTSKADSASTKTFDNRLPAGGISMITPNALAAAQYYKINDWVTFAWNYTSLSVTPSAIDILASCSVNSATYTIALNESVQATQTVLWDTRAFQANATVPLLTETYTLIVHDAAQAVSARASAGYLGTFQQFTFGMYTPQPYTPMADWVCATCNGALSSLQKNNLGFLFGMVGLTVLSFGWFTGIAGLW